MRPADGRGARRAAGHHDYTFAHSFRVASHLATFALATGMRRADAELLAQAGLLHDIGKTAIPVAILDKPGPLDSSEWPEVRRHPQVAAEVLERSQALPAHLIRIALRHHERLDGSGYPHGLRRGRDRRAQPALRDRRRPHRIDRPARLSQPGGGRRAFRRMRHPGRPPFRAVPVRALRAGRQDSPPGAGPHGAPPDQLDPVPRREPRARGRARSAARTSRADPGRPPSAATRLSTVSPALTDTITHRAGRMLAGLRGRQGAQAPQAALERGDIAASSPAPSAKMNRKHPTPTRAPPQHRPRRPSGDGTWPNPTAAGLPASSRALQVLQTLTGHPALLQVSAQIAARPRRACRTA